MDTAERRTVSNPFNDAENSFKFKSLGTPPGVTIEFAREYLQMNEGEPLLDGAFESSAEAAKFVESYLSSLQPKSPGSPEEQNESKPENIPLADDCIQETLTGSKFEVNRENIPISGHCSALSKPTQFSKVDINLLGRGKFSNSVHYPNQKCNVRKHGELNDGDIHVTLSTLYLRRQGVQKRSEKKYRCEHCAASFSHKCTLETHMRIHTGEKPFSCNECGTSFRHKNTLKGHIRTHTGEKPFRCDQCSACFSQKSHLKIHAVTHTSDKPYTCSQCAASFSIKGSLNRHMQVHTNGKPFSCGLCDAVFRRRCSLKQHIRLHKGERPFLCDQCGASFNVKNNFNDHIRIHTGEKPFRCNECAASFRKKCNLAKHTAVHIGEKSLKCNRCDGLFNRRSTLMMHIRRHNAENHSAAVNTSPHFIRNKVNVNILETN